MRIKYRGVVQIVFVVLLFLLTSILFSCKKSGDQKQVVLYCSVDQGLAEPAIAEFERQSGIDVLVRFDTEASKTVGLVQRIRAESASPCADVFWSGEVFHTIRLARESLLAAYESEETVDWPVTFKDPNGLWYGFALRARVIAYHTGRVTEAEAPKSLEDILDAKWKDRLVMAAPEFGTTGGDIASWFSHYGAERAKEILAGLKANGVRLVDGNSTAVRMVATGQADICFTDTDDVYAAQRNGWPVKMHYLDQGGDGPLTIPNTAAIIRGCANPEEAGILMKFLLSEQLEKMLAESYSHNSPVHRELFDSYKGYTVEKPLKISYSDVADKLPTAIVTAREILR